MVENQYRNLHSIVVPFNLLSVPVALCYFKVKGNPREKVNYLLNYAYVKLSDIFSRLLNISHEVSSVVVYVDSLATW